MRTYTIAAAALLALAGCISSLYGGTRYEKSAASGAESCRIYLGSYDIKVIRFRSPELPDPWWGILIGIETYPGDPVYLAVDGARYRGPRGSFGRADTAEIMAKLIPGAVVDYEWFTWPYRTRLTGRVTIKDFPERAAECLRLIPDRRPA